MKKESMKFIREKFDKDVTIYSEIIFTGKELYIFIDEYAEQQIQILQNKKLAKAENNS